MLKVRDLNVFVEDKKILNKINLDINEKEIVAIMGPNGSGKSTLARAIMNDKRLRKEGKIYFLNEDITDLDTYEIARRGIFLTFQNPPEIEYVKTKTFLRYILGDSYNENEIIDLGKNLGLPKDFLDRGINYNFSGGEKKKFELLLIELIKPKLVIFDEIDSGLDIDSLLMINEFIKEKLKEMSFIIITHYTRIFQNILPLSLIHI
mgnify:FL=1